MRYEGKRKPSSTTAIKIWISNLGSKVDAAMDPRNQSILNNMVGVCLMAKPVIDTEINMHMNTRGIPNSEGIKPSRDIIKLR